MRPLLRPLLLTSSALGLAVLVTVGAAGLPGDDPTPRPVPAPAAARPTPGIDPAALADRTNVVATLQARLTTTPEDHRSWSTLAMAYVEKARTTADPTYYRKADQALARAAQLAPGDSVMLTARGALAAARHDFRAALRASDAALQVNPYSAQAEAVRSDALTELGRYDAAARAASNADDLDPGPSTFARLSYQAELRGDLDEARRLMRLSMDAAGTSASSYAFAAFHLGELSRAQGRPVAAAHHYRNALDADPTYLPALAGRARLAVARGDIAAAERAYTRVVARLPLTEYVVELGELYEATDRPQQAAQQYAVATATARLLAASGVSTDLETAVFQADHGSATDALAAARGAWAQRRSIHTADALGWALHAAGRDRQALRYVRLATRLGTQDPRLLFHLGAVESALGLPAAAGHLRSALRLDAGASPWREAEISALLGGAR